MTRKALITILVISLFIDTALAIELVRVIKIERETQVLTIDELRANLDAIGYEPPTAEPVDVNPVTEWKSLGTYLVTAYCGCESCCGEWSAETPTTASGVTAHANHTIAVDTDVIPFGSIIQIDGIDYVAEDTGSAIQGECIDIYFDNHSDALAYGIQEHEILLKVE